jgi:hypothetical protein
VTRERDEPPRRQSGEAWLSRLQLLAEQLKEQADALLAEVESERERRSDA